MTGTRYVSELFNIRPPHWGLRGDPMLWQDMKQAFAETPLPYNARDLVSEIRRIFKEKTGTDLDMAVRPFVEAYAGGGPSSGKVSGKFWLLTAIPLLLAMRDIAEKDEGEFNKILKEGTSRYLVMSQPCTPQ